MQARLLDQPLQVTNRLNALGVPAEVLLESARSGLTARAASTPSHPPMHGGFVMYSESLATMGMLLAPWGWERTNEGGHPLVVHRERKLALAVLSGDERVGNGDPDLPPSTKTAKGPRTLQAIRSNQRKLFPEMELEPQELHPLDGY
jgi:hypothetical protein